MLIYPDPQTYILSINSENNCTNLDAWMALGVANSINYPIGIFKKRTKMQVDAIQAKLF
jgi:hypothetical protein